MEELKIALTVEEVNFVLNALSELPYKTVNSMFLKIARQAETQVNALQAKQQAEPRLFIIFQY